MTLIECEVGEMIASKDNAKNAKLEKAMRQ